MLPGPRLLSRLSRFLSVSSPHPHNKFQLPSATQHSRATRAMSSEKRNEPLSVGTDLRGRSGRSYNIQEILSERRSPLLCVYRASAEGENFVIKNMIPGEFEYQQDLQSKVASCPNLRTMIDTVPEFELFIYPFLAVDLLQASQQPLPKDTRKTILQNALTGLAELHDKGIVHTDIKPNNILLDYKENPNYQSGIQNVQISDLEDAVLLRPGKNLKGCVCGNQLWRSPESWARARQNTPSDIFSFGVVIIYVMLNDMVLRASDEELAGQDAWRHVLRRQISYFADEDGFVGLLKHIGEDNSLFEPLIDLGVDFDEERPRKPFTTWQYVDVELRDLVVKMTNLDPGRRITARDALAHPWFCQSSEDGSR